MKKLYLTCYGLTEKSILYGICDLKKLALLTIRAKVSNKCLDFLRNLGFHDNGNSDDNDGCYTFDQINSSSYKKYIKEIESGNNIGVFWKGKFYQEFLDSSECDCFSENEEEEED